MGDRCSRKSIWNELAGETYDPEQTQKPDGFGCIYAVILTMRHSLHYGRSYQALLPLKLLDKRRYCEVALAEVTMPT